LGHAHACNCALHIALPIQLQKCHFKVGLQLCCELWAFPSTPASQVGSETCSQSHAVRAQHLLWHINCLWGCLFQCSVAQCADTCTGELSPPHPQLRVIPPAVPSLSRRSSIIDRSGIGLPRFHSTRRHPPQFTHPQAWAAELLCGSWGAGLR